MSPAAFPGLRKSDTNVRFKSETSFKDHNTNRAKEYNEDSLKAPINEEDDQDIVSDPDVE